MNGNLEDVWLKAHGGPRKSICNSIIVCRADVVFRVFLMDFRVFGVFFWCVFVVFVVFGGLCVGFQCILLVLGNAEAKVVLYYNTNNRVY